MLELIFIALYQAAAGAPAETADQSTPTQPVTTIASSAQTELERSRQRVRDQHTRRCRFETTTGSRLGARVCMTQAEREQLEEAGRNLLTDSMRMWDNQSGPGGTLVCDRPGC
jgi:hypothetical protein